MKNKGGVKDVRETKLGEYSKRLREADRERNG